MKKILVPTDFSPFADNALKVAIEIARRAESEILLLHVMLTPASTSVDASRDKFLLQGASTDYLEEAVKGNLQQLESLISEFGYEHISPMVTSGKITQSILRTAENEKVDLVIMGTQGEGNQQDAFFVGSNTEKMVRLSEMPVLSIRYQPQNMTFKKLVYAINFDDPQELVLEPLQKLQMLFEAELHIVYINCPAHFQSTDALNRAFEKLSQKYTFERTAFHVYCDFLEGDGVLHFVESIGADLIVMATHQRTGFARLFGGSVSEEVVNTSRTPVMTLSLN